MSEDVIWIVTSKTPAPVTPDGERSGQMTKEETKELDRFLVAEHLLRLIKAIAHKSIVFE